MSSRFVSFRAGTGRKLKQLAGFNESQNSDSNRRPSGGFIIKTPSGGIAKRVSNTVTFVECDVYYIAGDGGTRTLTPSSGSKVWVGNMSTSDDVLGDTYVLPTMHGGALIANWEDCEGV